MRPLEEPTVERVIIVGDGPYRSAHNRKGSTLGVGCDSVYYLKLRRLFFELRLSSILQPNVVVKAFVAHGRVGTTCHRRINLTKLHLNI